MRLIVAVALAALVCTASVAQAQARTVTIAWDASVVVDPATDGVATGYRVAYGTAPQEYTRQVFVGAKTTRLTVVGLAFDQHYYFVVQGTSEHGNSLLSNELHVPPSDQPPPTIPPTPTGAGFMPLVKGTK
jgi:hypothetical protein